MRGDGGPGNSATHVNVQTIASVYEDSSFFIISQMLLSLTLLIGIIGSYIVALPYFSIPGLADLYDFSNTDRGQYLIDLDRRSFDAYSKVVPFSIFLGVSASVLLLYFYLKYVIFTGVGVSVNFMSALRTVFVLVVFYFILQFIYVRSPSPGDANLVPSAALTFFYPIYPALAGFGSASIAIISFVAIGSLFKIWWIVSRKHS